MAQIHFPDAHSPTHRLHSLFPEKLPPNGLLFLLQTKYISLLASLSISRVLSLYAILLSHNNQILFLGHSYPLCCTSGLYETSLYPLIFPNPAKTYGRDKILLSYQNNLLSENATFSVCLNSIYSKTVRIYSVYQFTSTFTPKIC